MDSVVTVVGNLTKDPELRFMNSGQATVRLGVAVNRRWKSKQTDEFEEKTSFFDVSAFGSLAENVANSLAKGDRVVITGRLEQRTWETDAGEKRNVVEINADDIAPSLRFATASVARTARREAKGIEGTWEVD